MGDAGSLTLGYVISFLIIHMSVTNEVSPTLSNPYMVIAFSTVLVPLLDVIRVVLHRLREHKNPFLPDKNHFHHKLLRTGNAGADGDGLYHRDFRFLYPA